MVGECNQCERAKSTKLEHANEMASTRKQQHNTPPRGLHAPNSPCPGHGPDMNACCLQKLKFYLLVLGLRNYVGCSLDDQCPGRGFTWWPLVRVQCAVLALLIFCCFLRLPFYLPFVSVLVAKSLDNVIALFNILRVANLAHNYLGSSCIHRTDRSSDRLVSRRRSWTKFKA